MTKTKKAIAIVASIIIIVLGIIIYYRYYFVFGEGVKAGNLNYVVKKGYFFKTYEGKIIQDGIKSRQTGTVQSNEFEFSVSNNEIASKMMENSGKNFELRYKEYKNPLPWRGFSNYVVYEIISMKEPQP